MGDDERAQPRAGLADQPLPELRHPHIADERFAERFPELLDRVPEFKASSELRSLPTLRYPALLRAALAAEPTERKACPSNGYDIEHLTIGLSRCDIVTADGSMTRIARERASSLMAASSSSSATSQA